MSAHDLRTRLTAILCVLFAGGIGAIFSSAWAVLVAIVLAAVLVFSAMPNEGH